MILFGALNLLGAISVEEISGKDTLSLPGGYNAVIKRFGGGTLLVS